MLGLDLTFHILFHYEYAYLLFTDEVHSDVSLLIAYQDLITKSGVYAGVATCLQSGKP